MYTSIKNTHWWYDFPWAWSGIPKETIKTLRSQKQKDKVDFMHVASYQLKL